MLLLLFFFFKRERVENSFSSCAAVKRFKSAQLTQRARKMPTHTHTHRNSARTSSDFPKDNGAFNSFSPRAQQTYTYTCTQHYKYSPPKAQFAFLFPQHPRTILSLLYKAFFSSCFCFSAQLCLNNPPVLRAPLSIIIQRKLCVYDLLLLLI